MINAIIIDDEQSNIDTLCSILKEYGLPVSIVGSAMNIAQAVSLINKEKPQLVFLDVELGKETGFELFRSFPDPDFEVIFTTAHEKYALRAIKASALEFLLKPIDPKELTAAIQKFEKEKRKETDSKKIEALLQNSAPSRAGQKIAIPSADGYSFVDSGEIVCCEADMNYTYVYTGKERVLSSRTLKEFEEMLDQSKFFRCHKSWLINLDHIRKYSRTDGTRVLMSNEKWVDISVRKREEFLKLFDKF